MSVNACSEAVPGGGSPNAQALASGNAKLACDAPQAILTTPSRFHEALVIWSREPAGSVTANAAMDAACDAAMDEDARGTEHGACALMGLAYASGDGVKRDAVRAFAYLDRAAICGLDFRAHDLAQERTHAIAGSAVGCCGGRGCESGCEALCAKALDQVLAVELEPPLRAACNRGRGAACYMMASLVMGQHVSRVGSLQAKGDRGAYLEKACKNGVGAACDWQAGLIAVQEMMGDGFDEARARGTRSRAIPYSKSACNAGWGDSCLGLGMILDKEGKRADAVPYWEKACELGLTRVCQELGDMLSTGDGVPRDHEHAVAVYAKGWR